MPSAESRAIEATEILSVPLRNGPTACQSTPAFVERKSEPEAAKIASPIGRSDLICPPYGPLVRSHDGCCALVREAATSRTMEMRYNVWRFIVLSGLLARYVPATHE